MDLADIKTFHQITKEYFLLTSHGTFKNQPHIEHKVCLKVYMKIKVTVYILSDHKAIKQDGY